MSGEGVGVSPDWLYLREPADAAARSAELADRLGRHLATARRFVIHDLGGGSGAMGRWLAPRLPGPQHWVVHDRDADLLELAAAAPAAGVTVEVRRSDITRLNGNHADLASAWLGGWVAAACEQEPALAAEAGAYRDRRLEQAAAGELAVTVDHADLLVLP